MKKVSSLLLCLVLVMGLAAFFAGCSNEPACETYYLYEMVEDGVTYNTAQIQQDLSEVNPNVKVDEMFYLKMYDDGSAIWCSMGIETAMKYNATQIWTVADSSAVCSYTREGDIVSIQDGAATMIFKKK